MITVVLLRPETSGNIGFIARAMANFDLENLILVGALCDPKDDDAQKKSMHAKGILTKAKIKDYSYFSSGKIKKDFNLVVGTTSIMGDDYNVPRMPLLIEELVKKVTDEKAVIIFGNEGTGLSNEEIKMCDFIVSIPSSKKYPALNISHAASIIFYEFYKKNGKDKINSHIKQVSRKEKEIIESNFYGILDEMDFATPDKKETQKEVWKKVFSRAMMSKREAFSVIGLLRKIRNKISRP
jgi:TrmH family RNA methyltransferase